MNVVYSIMAIISSWVSAVQTFFSFFIRVHFNSQVLKIQMNHFRSFLFQKAKWEIVRVREKIAGFYFKIVIY